MQELFSLFALRFYIFILLLFSNQAFSSGKSIELIAGLAKPPFIFEQNEQGYLGLQLDIINAAFALENIQVNYTHMPLGRVITGFQQWDVDGVITLPANYQYPNMYMSVPYITYENVAVSLANKQLVIDSIEALSGKSVMAFQRAKKYLGKAFNSVVSDMIDYREIADQEKQIHMLFAGRTEVVIADINIVKYFVQQNPHLVQDKEIVFHHIFHERNYAAGFKDKTMRDLFNRGVSRMKEDGTYQILKAKYQH